MCEHGSRLIFRIRDHNSHSMPSEPHQNHLLIVEDDKGECEYVLSESTYSIGRDAACDIRLVSQFVSRRHATLMLQTSEGGIQYYRIVDSSSSNGLLINGRKLKAHNLQNKDVIVFGPKVRAIYYSLRRDAFTTIPPDEFDITLISPNMIGDPEDDDEAQDDSSRNNPFRKRR